MVTATKTIESVIEQAEMLVNVQKPIDQRAPLAQFLFQHENGKAEVRPLLEEAGTFGDPIGLTDLALGQLLERVKYPRQLLQRLPNGAVFNDLNYLMQHGDAERLAMLRYVNTDSGKLVRAVLGSAYTPLDDIDLLRLAQPYLEGAKVVYDSMGEFSTHITAIWENKAQVVADRELLQGVHIANSEVGQRSISIEAILFTPACANILPGYYSGDRTDATVYEGSTVKARRGGKGYMGNTDRGWRFRHVGGDTNKLADFVESAMSDVSRQYEVAVARWRDGLDKQVADMAGAIETVANAGNLTQEGLKAALNAMSDPTQVAYGRTVTGVANAFTLGAQSMEDAETRYDMQQAGALAFRTLN